MRVIRSKRASKMRMKQQRRGGATRGVTHNNNGSNYSKAAALGERAIVDAES